MTTEDNHRTARRVVLEAFNAESLQLIDMLLSPDCVDHALPPGIPPNREGLKATPPLRAAFPDLEYTIEDQLAEGDRVAQRLTARGTLRGEFLGMQPTGKTAVWQEIHWLRFDTSGRLSEHWQTSDELGMLMQLGLSPGQIGGIETNGP